MELYQFLEKTLQEPSVLYEEKFIFCLRGAEQAPLFYTAFAQHLSSILALNPVNIDLRAYTEEAHIDALLDISFLGQGSLYLLRHSASLSTSIQKYLYFRLSTYKGPHFLIVPVEEDCALLSHTSNSAIFVLNTSKQLVDYSLYVLLIYFLTGKPIADKDLAAKIFEQHKHVSLEEACMIIRYHVLLGRHTEGFIASWLDRLVATDHSLFLLSQHLFSRNSYAFVAMWNHVRSLYPDEFWVAFWSEQLWQASFFIKEAQTSSSMVARKRVNRLPFSFINKDWQKYTFAELTQAHNFLYTIDYNLKNGSGSLGLDLFFAKFLNNFFAIPA